MTASRTPGPPGDAGVPPATRPWSVRALVLYYLGTPAFAVLDLLFHVPVRVALPEGWIRSVYYATAFGLGLLCYRRPALAPWVGMGESAVNLTLLMLAVLLPLWTGPEALLAGGESAGTDLLLRRVANLALGGTVMVVGFHRSQAELLARGRRR